jgi:hypothetical protein
LLGNLSCEDIAPVFEGRVENFFYHAGDWMEAVSPRLNGDRKLRQLGYGPITTGDFLEGHDPFQGGPLEGRISAHHGSAFLPVRFARSIP